eukprot:SAG31_NODE_5897_length_2267_cov_1.670664_4_plen_193_part_00
MSHLRAGKAQANKQHQQEYLAAKHQKACEVYAIQQGYVAAGKMDPASVMPAPDPPCDGSNAVAPAVSAATPTIASTPTESNGGAESAPTATSDQLSSATDGDQLSSATDGDQLSSATDGEQHYDTLHQQESSSEDESPPPSEDEPPPPSDDEPPPPSDDEPPPPTEAETMAAAEAAMADTAGVEDIDGRQNW